MISMNDALRFSRVDLAGQLTAILTFTSCPKLLCIQYAALYSMPSVLKRMFSDIFRLTSQATRLLLSQAQGGRTKGVCICKVCRRLRKAMYMYRNSNLYSICF